ncbi:hypothetical protein BD410DRAFT_838064 [Rickenella mellea]|uniref:Uncharacterized protein n=1 Tax=Rickenella mellea TaxID=50990 RepID=A0A4Y7QBT8_9AGAM|nr:hypothetical protein BD410DRAFT_838064 [Rickenella mellea]
MSASEDSLQLKAEGNALFLEKKYVEASEKYTSAIELDGENAILWANRAAYLDACHDAKTATTIDPTYAKAWGRLASSFQEVGLWEAAVDAWKRALSALPMEDRTPSDDKQKEQYSSGLAKAENFVRENFGRVADTYNIDDAFGAGRNKLPWVRAENMLSQLREKGPQGLDSCAWVIAPAAKELEDGMKIIRDLKTVETPGGIEMMIARPGALQALTNSIVRDQRVFHMESKDIDNYTKQTRFEAQKLNAWVTAGPEHILVDAEVLLKTRGWDYVRPAISTTVRGWMMKAFISLGLEHAPGPAVQFYQSVVELLERGRQIWHNVPAADRGAVFTDAFVRGVKRLLLDGYMQAYGSNPGKNSAYPLQRLYEMADEIIKDVDNNLPMKSDGNPEWDVQPGDTEAYYMYTKGEALAVKGLYHMQFVKHEVDMEGADNIVMHLIKASSLYQQAADMFPMDEEKHCWYLYSSLCALWRAKAPLKVTLPLIAKTREVIPQMRSIWEHSVLQVKTGNMMLQLTLDFEDEVRKGLNEGLYTEDDSASPGWASDPKA